MDWTVPSPISETPSPFFQKSSLPFVQTKLTIGQPGDKYEQEADSVADQVVQRLAQEETPGIQQQTEPTSIQAKCNDCEQEEQVQKKEEPEELPETAPEVQSKEIAEAPIAPPPELQTQTESPAITPPTAEPATISPVPVPADSSLTPSTHSLQAQAEPEAQEELQGEEEVVQSKPIFDSAADPPEEDTVQRACAECEQEELTYLSRTSTKIGGGIRPRLLLN